MAGSAFATPSTSRREPSISIVRCPTRDDYSLEPTRISVQAPKSFGRRAHCCRCCSCKLQDRKITVCSLVPQSPSFEHPQCGGQCGKGDWLVFLDAGAVFMDENG